MFGSNNGDIDLQSCYSHEHCRARVKQLKKPVTSVIARRLQAILSSPSNVSMEGLKKTVIDWLRVTKGRVVELRSVASTIHGEWEELKGTTKERMDERQPVEQADVEMLSKLRLIEKDVCSLAGMIESWCAVKKDETIDLDELVEGALREKEGACRRRKEPATKRKHLERGKDIEDPREVEATKIVAGLGAMLDLYGDDGAAKLVILSRVEESLAEYLKVDDRYCNGEVETHEVKERGELFTVGSKSDELDCALLKYVFDEERDPRELLVATDTLSLRREEILPLSLITSATKKVVDIFIEMLTLEERKLRGNRARFWWIPTYITRPLEDENYVLDERRRWSKWIGNLDEVCKIYVPVKLREEWFLAIIHVEDHIVEVTCSDNEHVVQQCLAVVHDVLEALDVVLNDEIVEFKPIGWRFTDFEVYQGHVPVKLDSNGMFVMKVMNAVVDEGVIHNHGGVADEVTMVALQILKSDVNKARFVVASRACSVARGVVGEV